jgi:hypothetical protein
MKAKQASPPDVAYIKARAYGDTYIACEIGSKVRASCTQKEDVAAERCADKIFGKGKFTIVLDDPQHEAFVWFFTAKRKTEVAP